MCSDTHLSITATVEKGRVVIMLWRIYTYIFELWEETVVPYIKTPGRVGFFKHHLNSRFFFKIVVLKAGKMAIRAMSQKDMSKQMIMDTQERLMRSYRRATVPQLLKTFILAIIIIIKRVRTHSVLHESGSGTV